MLRRGLCYFPSDRVAEGLALGTARPRERLDGGARSADLRARGILQRRERAARHSGDLDQLKLRPPQIERTVANLSGGNRQKVLLARGLTRDIKVFLFDEPTVGIDVGAKIEVYELMKALVAAGAAIILVSSELPEVMNLSHRLYVMHRSRMVAELDRSRYQRDRSALPFLPARRGREDGVRARKQRIGNGMARARRPRRRRAGLALRQILPRLRGGRFPADHAGRLIILFAIFVPHFLALQNVFNVLRSSSYLVILAAGQMLVLIVGGFDLSVGAVVALTSVVQRAGHGLGSRDRSPTSRPCHRSLGVLAGLGCGLLVGLVNGLCVAFLSVSPFMVSSARCRSRPASLCC